MTYHTYALLTEDIDFGRRSRSCITEQANGFLTSSTAPDIHALSQALLKNYPAQTQAMLQAIAAGPGFADAVDNGDGTIDETKVTDGEMLSQCQAMYPTVASLFYDSTGAPITGP